MIKIRDSLFHGITIRSTTYLVNKYRDSLKELISIKENGNVIGITAISIGPSMVMTAVDDII